MLIGIGERLKVEWATPTDLPPTLEDTLKRLKEEKDKLESGTKVYLWSSAPSGRGFQRRRLVAFLLRRGWGRDSARYSRRGTRTIRCRLNRLSWQLPQGQQVRDYPHPQS
jgi:hypothetical protein